jgi:hypothetical protein
LLVVEKYLRWILEFLNGALTPLVASFARFAVIGNRRKRKDVSAQSWRTGEKPERQSFSVVNISLGNTVYSRGLE